MAHGPSDIDLVESLCAIAGQVDLIDDLREELTQAGIIASVESHDGERLIDWLLEIMSLQGISDIVALRYLEEHGSASSATISASLQSASCDKLSSYWSFEGCHYEKSWGTCANPHLVGSCPLPQLDLRNGHLNQTAFALTLFCRDVTGGDLVGWIDAQLAAAAAKTGNNQRARWVALRQALLEPLGHVFGISNKVLSMALSDLLIGAGGDRELWLETGTSMVAIDTLVHNWVHRTGVSRRRGTPHPYGPRCYQPGGCAEVIEDLSLQIDARQFGLEFPEHFPRFVQKAIWRFCAAAELNRCNGNRIDDRVGCRDEFCPLAAHCDRLPLRADAKVGHIRRILV